MKHSDMPTQHKPKGGKIKNVKCVKGGMSNEGNNLKSVRVHTVSNSML